MQAPAGPRWIALDAKSAIQDVDPIAVPRALALQRPEVREVWLITPGGDETRLSGSCVQIPIRRLADRLSSVLAGD